MNLFIKMFCAIWLAYIPFLAWASTSIYSEALEQQREFIVSLPSNYENSKDSYPLLLVMDGEHHINHLRQAANLLYQSGFPEIVIVGIMHPDRASDLTFKASKDAPTGGNAESFRLHLTEELIPWLKQNYRISDHTTLYGHSAGGLFAAYALSQAPDSFNGMIVISPTVRWDDFSLIPKLKKSISNKRKITRVFSAYGNETGLEKQGFKKWDDLISSYSSQIPFDSRWFPEEDHNSVNYLGGYYGLKSIFGRFIPNSQILNADIGTLQNYYADISKEYGVAANPPQRILLNKGIQYKNSGQYKEAIDVFKVFKSYYTGNPLPLIQLAETYELAEKYNEALQTYLESKSIMLWPADLNERITKIQKKLEN